MGKALLFQISHLWKTKRWVKVLRSQIKKTWQKHWMGEEAERQILQDSTINVQTGCWLQQIQHLTACQLMNILIWSQLHKKELIHLHSSISHLSSLTEIARRKRLSYSWLRLRKRHLKNIVFLNRKSSLSSRKFLWDGKLSLSNYEKLLWRKKDLLEIGWLLMTIIDSVFSENRLVAWLFSENTWDKRKKRSSD